MSKLIKFGPPLPEVEIPETSLLPDWQQARPRDIARALERALDRPHGNWYVVGESRLLAEKPQHIRIAGQDLVAWRVDGELLIAADACPHMGASLADSRVCEGKLICPWHSLAVGKGNNLTVHEDGVLSWVRVGPEVPDTPLPVLPQRPDTSLEGVVQIEVGCDPEDIIANRLDPWHGVHFHPYAFASLTVLDLDDDVLTVRVAKRLIGRVVAETDATFHSPEPRSIVMTIIEGEGRGSVVETHATPIEPGRTMVVEATLATSDRKGFRHARKLQRLIRPFIERSARRLWVDDAAYAERLYELRNRQSG